MSAGGYHRSDINKTLRNNKKRRRWIYLSITQCRGRVRMLNYRISHCPANFDSRVLLESILSRREAPNAKSASYACVCIQTIARHTSSRLVFIQHRLPRSYRLFISTYIRASARALELIAPSSLQIRRAFNFYAQNLRSAISARYVGSKVCFCARAHAEFA